ncbi:MAG: Ig-like domain-containing protein [Limisphaerales bacterium]
MLEDSGPFTQANFATNILAGPADESGQVVSFVVTNDNNALFSSQPAISVAGTLSFTTALNAFGSATVTVVARDNGGTVNGGVDTSAPQTFSITVTPVNDPPTVSFATNNVVVLEDGGASTVSSFANVTGFGSGETGQTLLGHAVANNNNGLFSVQPSIDTSGTLTFTPATNANGSATVTVVSQDSGGTAIGGVDKATNTFTITVTPVNDAPSFALLVGGGGSVVTNHTVIAWGYNSNDQTNVPAGLTNVTAMAGGVYYSLALKSDGTVVAWGASPVVPAGLTNVTAIAAGSYHSLALKSDGTVVAWGDNSNGQSNVPAGLTNVTAIAAGYGHSLALKSDGTVVAWGDNSNGQSNVPAGLTNVTAIAAGNWHSLALKNDGTVVAWGYNTDGETNVPGSLTNVTAIASRVTHSLALKSDGTVVAWGDTFSGGINVPAGLTNVTAVAAGFRYSLALKSDGTVVGWGFNGDGQTTMPSGLTNVTAIAAGFWHSLAIYTTYITNGTGGITVLEDSGPFTQAYVATNILAGPADESGQVVSFVVTNNNNALFSVQPAIGTNGTLTFTPALNASGSATVTVYAQDDGGILNGGVDTSAAQTFTITVTTVNDAPQAVFALNPLEVMKNSSATNIPGFATFVKGPVDESGQSVTNVTVSNDNNALFDVGGQPAIGLDGTLSFTPAAGASGTALVTVITTDNGGTANGGQNTGTNTFVINVVSANIYVEATAAVAAGNSITVPVSILADGDENGVGFTLTFNSALLTYTGITAESGLTLVANAGQAGSGLLGVVLSKPTDNTFSGGYNPMVYVTFTVATGAPATNTTVGFSSAVAFQQVTDKNANNIPYVSYTPNVVTITALAVGLEGDVTPRPTGNGSVTVSDAVQIGRFAAGLDTITSFGAGSEFQRADCAPLGTQGDGRVTVADWVQSLRFAAGLDASGVVGGPTLQAAALAATSARLPAGARTVRVAGGSLIAGRANMVSIQLDSQGDEAGISLSLAFDPTVLTFVSAVTGGGASGGSLMINGMKAAAGRVGLVLVMPAGGTIAAGTRDIVTLTFNVTGSGSTAISVTGDSPVAREVADVNANVLGASFVGGSFNILLPAGLKAAGMERAPDGSLRLVVGNADGTAVTSVQAAKYQVYVTGNLGGAWTLLPDALVVENGALKIVDPAANGAGLRLYKLVETTP